MPYVAPKPIRIKTADYLYEKRDGTWIRARLLSDHEDGHSPFVEADHFQVELLERLYRIEMRERAGRRTP